MCEHSQRQLDETRQENKVIFFTLRDGRACPLSSGSRLAIEEVQGLSPILTACWSRAVPRFNSSTLPVTNLWSV